MAGEVRGTFSLNDRPATEAMRRLQRQGEELDLVLDKLGKTVDGVFSSENVAEVKLYEEALSRLDSQARRTFNSIGRNAREAEFQVVGSIRRMDSSVILFRENLDALSREKATPKINLKGVDEALAQTELLHKRINALGREVATPRVGVSQSSFVSGAANRAAGGGGSSFGGGRGGLNIPFAGTAPWALVGGALAAAPPLIGATTALGGSLAGAALGAGSIGLGAAGVGATALGEIAPVAVSSIIGIKAASKALKSYREEVIRSGVNSEAAKEKYRLYNMELEKAPIGTARFLRAKEGLVEDFQSSTKPAQRGFTGIGTRGLNLGRQLTPQFSRLSNEFFNEAQPQANKFADFVASSESRQFFESMGRESKAALAPTEQIAESTTGTLMNLSRAARPFFHEGLMFLDKWTRGWHTSSKDVRGTREDMARWVGDLKTWAKLTGATFELLKDLGSAGAGEGNSLVGDLTKQLEVWDEWVQHNPREVRTFFKESVESTEKLAGAIGKIASLIWQIGRQLGPMLDQLSNLVTLAGNAGLLTPGGLPLLLAGGAGLRSATRGLGTRIRGAVPGMGGGFTEGAVAGAALGGGAAGAEAAAFRPGLGNAYRIYRNVGERGVLGAGLGAARTTAAGAGLERFGRGFAGRFLPFALLSGALGAAGTQGNFHERIQGGLSQATFGIIPPPQSIEEKYSGGYHDALESLRNNQIVGHHMGLGRERRWDMELRQARAQSQYGGTDPSLQGAAAGYRSRAEDIEARQTAAASSMLGDLTGAFDIRGRHGAGDKANYQRTIDGIERRVSKLHGRTRKEFSQMGIDWAAEVAKANPKLKRAYDEMAEQMETRLRKAGAEIRVINGNIVDVSAKSWGKVADLIGSATQRAYEEANKNFTALERRAFSILREMGFSSKDAKGLVHEAEVGHPSKAKSAEAAEAHRHGMTAPPTTSQIPGMGHAAGGRLPVPANGSERDEVYMGGGQWGAGNELVVPSHTERQVNQILGRAGKTLGGMVAMNNRAHWQMPSAATDYAAGGRRFAVGGRQRGGGQAWRGIGPAGVHQGARTVAEAIMGHFPGLQATSTTSGGHVSGSLHFLGEAVDLAGSSPEMFAASNWIEKSGLYRQLTEGIHNPNLSVSDGRNVPSSFYSAVWAEHANHIHIGVAHEVARLAAATRRGGFRGGGVGGAAQIHLRGRHSGLGGVPGALADRGSELMAAGMSRNLNKLIGRGHGGGRGGSTAAPGGSRSAVERQIAQELFRHGANKTAAAGIIGNAYRESGMDPGAEGTGGGGLWGFTAGAISLANLKAAGGSNWESPGFQTRFMLSHGGQGLIGRLNAAGSPEAAAALFMNEWERPGIPAQGERESAARAAFRKGFSRGGRASHGFAGWFADGFHGRVNEPTLMGVGEAGTEEVHITPTPKRGSAGRRRGSSDRPIHVEVNMGPVSVHGRGDTEKVGKEIGQHAARELTRALQQSDDVRDGELIGG
jgi:hypothetical protein